MKGLNSKGFTLIELMIVLAVIGVLSVVLIPKALPLKDQAKNNGVQANVYIVRSFLENRVGADRVSIVSKPDATSIDTVLCQVKDDIATKMNTTFSGSSAVKNPFNNKTGINSTNLDIKNNDPGDSSVVIGYDTANIPTNVSSITSTISTPGVIAIIVYQTGYVVYGVDNFGGILQPTLINMPKNVAQLPVITNPPASDQSILPNVTAVVNYLNGKVIEDIVVAKGISTTMSNYRYPLMKTDLGTTGADNTIINPYGTTVIANNNYTAIGNSILIAKDYYSSNNLNYSNYKGFVVVDLLSNGNGYVVYGIDSKGTQIPTPAITISGSSVGIGASTILGSSLNTVITTLQARVGNDVSTMNDNHSAKTYGAAALAKDLYGGGDGLLSLQATLAPNIIYNADDSQWSQISPPQTTSLTTSGYSIILSSDINKNINNFSNYRGAIVVYINYTTNGNSGKDSISGYTVYGINSDGTPTAPNTVN